jgi:hypothetical protein
MPTGWEDPLLELPEWDITDGKYPAPQLCPKCDGGPFWERRTLLARAVTAHGDLDKRARALLHDQALRRAGDQKRAIDRRIAAAR